MTDADEAMATDIRAKIVALRESIVTARKAGITVVTPLDYQLVNWLLGGNAYAATAGLSGWHIHRTEL